MDPREELVLPPLEIPAAPARPLREAAVVHRARRSAQRDLASRRSGARGHFGQSRRPVVGDPTAVRRESVVYVWFDALINYAAAVGYGWDEERRTKWWPADLHIIGKDITRFHCVIWPAMLMSAKLPLPAQVFGHGWISVNGQRMSKSLGNVIDPVEAAERFGADPLRLYLTKEVPYGGDGDFTLGAAGREVQRRPGQQPRQPGESGRGDDRAVPPGPAAGGLDLGRLSEVAGARLSRITARRWIAWRSTKAWRRPSGLSMPPTSTSPRPSRGCWRRTRPRPSGSRRCWRRQSRRFVSPRLLLLPVMPTAAAEILRRAGETRVTRDIRLDRRRVAAGGETHSQRGAALASS